MADYPALPLWTDAFVGDTLHLSAEEVGVYCLLLFTAWRRPDCDLPDDDKYLAKVARCTTKKWTLLRPVMARFHHIEGGRWTQHRLLKERKYVSDLSKRNSAKANRRWNKNNDIGNTVAMPQQCSGNAPIPIPKEESKKDKMRATRWRADTKVSSDWLDHALLARRRNSLPDIDLKLEAEKFENFWTGKSGAQATKLDWHRTWINWVLNAKGQQNGRGPSANDKFLAGAANAIREALGPSNNEGDNVVVGPFGRPLLPP